MAGSSVENNQEGSLQSSALNRESPAPHAWQRQETRLVVTASQWGGGTISV